MEDESSPLSESHSFGPIPDMLAIDLDDLLSLQTRKAKLFQERDALAQRRGELKQLIERLSVSLSHYKKQQLQYDTKQKLDYYLRQNDHESTKLTRPDEAASFVLKNLNVLPTTDMTLRRKLIDKFYPCMAVSDDTVLTIYEDNELLTVISFQLSAKGLPPLTVRLSIKDETVHWIELIEYYEVAHVFQKISQSFCRALTQNYCRLKKIDVVVHSYHSLAQLQQVRIALLTKILHKYADAVTRPASWVSDPNLTLMSLSYIELTFPDKSKKETFKVRLQWDIILENTAIGNVESQLHLSVHRENAGPLKDANDVFLTLVQQHGIVDALTVMLVNLFGVQA